MTQPDQRYRITFDVSEDVYFRAQRAIPHGMRKIIFSAMTEDLVKLLENCSPELKEKFLGMVANRLVDTTTILETPQKAREADGSTS